MSRTSKEDTGASPYRGAHEHCVVQQVLPLKQPSPESKKSSTAAAMETARIGTKKEPVSPITKYHYHGRAGSVLQE